MSVMMGDATGERPVTETLAGFESLLPAEEATKISHLAIDVPGLNEADAAPGIAPAAENDAAHQAMIALSVSDVMDLGTEQIDGLDALVIHGAAGDVVQLSGDAGYRWSRDDQTESPSGYDIYLATHANVGDAPASSDAAGGHPVYVLVQQEMTVVLTGA